MLKHWKEQYEEQSWESGYPDLRDVGTYDLPEIVTGDK